MVLDVTNIGHTTDQGTAMKITERQAIARYFGDESPIDDSWTDEEVKRYLYLLPNHQYQAIVTMCDK